MKINIFLKKKGQEKIANIKEKKKKKTTLDHPSLSLEKTLPLQVMSISFFPPSPHPSQDLVPDLCTFLNSIIQFPSSALFAHTRLLWYFSCFQTQHFHLDQFFLLKMLMLLR